MSGERGLRVSVLALLAPAGVLLGHAVGYALAVPDPHFRKIVMESTGHGWWTLALPVSMCMAIAAALMVIARSARAGRPLWAPAGGHHWTRLGMRLAATQIVAFWVLEIGERLLMHGTARDLFLEGILLAGTAAQLLVAIIVTHLVWILATAAGSGGASPVLIHLPRPVILIDASPRRLRCRKLPRWEPGPRAPPAVRQLC